MENLHEEFNYAAERVQALDSRPGNQELLKLYGLYKQASEGDAGSDRPGITNPRGRAKYDAWVKLKGMSQDDAKTKYIALVDELDG